MSLLIALLAFWTFFPGGALDGEPAPVFTAKALEGGEVDLAAHLGKEVLVVNFWASWCPPCREEMPALSRLAAELRGQPVRFYAVNEGEDPATIHGFLKAANVTLEVLLDEDGGIADEYQVQALPTTFIIGKDGIVAHTHRGFGRGMEDEIREQVLALL